MREFLILLFGKFRWYRRWIGGTWARYIPGYGFWMPYKPLDYKTIQQLVEMGRVEFEDYSASSS